MGKFFIVSRKSHQLTDTSFKRKNKSMVRKTPLFEYNGLYLKKTMTSRYVQLFVTRVRLHGFDSLKACQLVNTSFTHAQTFDCYVHSTVPQATFFVSYRTSSLHVIISLTDSQQPGIHLSIGQSRLQTSCCIIRCIIDSGLSREVDDQKQMMRKHVSVGSDSVSSSCVKKNRFSSFCEW